MVDSVYDTNWYRKALLDKDIMPCIPPRHNRKEDIYYDKKLYKQRHKIENLFGRLKDWHRIAMHYDRWLTLSFLLFASLLVLYGNPLKKTYLKVEIFHKFVIALSNTTLN